MGRNRVLSFMSQLSGGHRDSRTPSPPNDGATTSHTFASLTPRKNEQAPSPPEPFPAAPGSVSPVRAEQAPGAFAGGDSPSASPQGRQRSTSRPMSMIQTYQPHVMDINDTIPELQPVFTLLNSHANKLYQEGYFLKLDDQNTQGRPNPDRNWTECFAQLVGTVLSLWDAAELDAAGEDGEVLPKFINLTDASIKVIESLPTQSPSEQPLQNILSVSTAGRNRYLLLFNSHHSLIQWTSGIRLAMYEHSTLQEAYTGALIAGKGKSLNNINLIMSRSRFKTEEWVRVRFGAGVPWRRCWCVITPPDEKELQKQQREWKKRSPYDRSHMPVLKGDIKFYDTRKEGKKQKKAKPIATVTNAYSAYAIYPQAKALIDASTLIKLEGTITIHSDPPSTSEGFVFLMPEVHPAVTGFEMLLRFLFPIWDTFGLYGRPGRLVASILDPRSLMFAMPKHRRYGYLEILDVSSLVLSEGSSSWAEREWRKRLKDLTAKRMAAMDEGTSSEVESGRTSNRSSKRLSFGFGPSQTNNGATVGERPPSARPKVNFADDSESPRSSRSLVPALQPSIRTDSAPPATERQRAPSSMAQAAAIAASHARNHSDSGTEGQTVPGGTVAYNSTGHAGQPGQYQPSSSPSPPIRGFVNDLAPTPERVSSEDEVPSRNPTPPRDLEDMHQRLQTPEPVQPPPAFYHPPSSRPAAPPFHSPEMRRANSRLSSSTLAQMVHASGVATAENWPPSSNHETRPNSQGSSRGNLFVPQQGIASSASAPVLVQSNAAASASFSPSPLNQTHSALSPAAEITESPLSQPAPPAAGPLHGAGPVPTGPLPQVPPHTGHPPPHLHEAENGRQMLLTQGPPPPPPYHSASQPQPTRLRTPPPNVGHDTGSPPLSPIQTSPPIQRKPVPSRTDNVQRSKEASEPQSAVSSAGSLQDYYIDEAALAQVHQTEDDGPDRRGVLRQDTKRSEASSKYDDASSTTSPDYASTHESVKTQESVERPRAGVLRTVGDAVPVSQPRQEALDIPEVNFGPTINYAAQSIPRNKTPTPLVSSASSRAHSPAQAPGATTPTPLRKSPRDQQRPADMGHFRQDSDDTIRRRSVAWQPGSAVVGSVGGASGAEGRSGSMTPEQFVLQRASQAAAPIYSHQRVPSNNSLATMRNNTPSPAMRRRSSYDMLGSAPNPQFQQQQRPSSQGATSALDSHSRNNSADVGAHLSAREQEHLARMTGTPLINMAANPRGQQTGGGPGLVGAIAAREWEKQQMKEGVSSQAVQHAINQRQQIQFQQQQQAQQQYYLQQQQQQHAQIFGSPSPSMYGGYQLPPGHGPPMPRPQMGSAQSNYGSQAGWVQPSMPGVWPSAQNAPQAYQQGYSGGVGQQYNQAQANTVPRSRTPGPSGQGMMYPGQAF